MGSKILEEGVYAGGFLVSESTIGGTGQPRGRSIATYAVNEDIKAGQILHMNAANEAVAFVDGTTGEANAISYDNVAAQDGTTARITVIHKDAVVNPAEIVFTDAETASGIAAALVSLKAVGIEAADGLGE